MSRGRWSRINAARGRKTPGDLNRAETAFARHLELQRLAGKLAAWEPKPIKLRLARGSFYEPDFMLLEPLDLVVTFVEVKGSAGWSLDDEGRTKWKVAGERFPMFRFRGAVQVKGGGWSFEDYEPVGRFPLVDLPEAERELPDGPV